MAFSPKKGAKRGDPRGSPRVRDGRESTDYEVKLIGGHYITRRKVLFSFDSKLLLVPSNDCIRVYYIQTGNLVRVLSRRESGGGGEGRGGKEKLSQNEELIVNLQLHPMLPMSQVISFSVNGRLILWDYLEGIILRELLLFKQNAPSLSTVGSTLDFRRPREVTFARVAKYKHSHEAPTGYSNYYIVYFSLLNEETQQCTLQYVKLDDLDKPLVSSPSKAGKKQKTGETETSPHQPKSLRALVDPDLGELGIAFGAGNGYVAVICGTHLKGFTLPPGNDPILHLSQKPFTCVAAHPSEVMVATGDTLGRIVLWGSDFLEATKPLKTILHWHTLPLADVCFSPTGSYLYSAGGESVLVRWDLLGSNEKNFLPRLGLPLRYVVTDRNHQRLALSQTDNSIQIIPTDFSDREKRTLEGLTLGFGGHSIESSGLPTAGLHWDPKSEALVFNGRPGHIQFYSPYFGRQLFQLDIVGRNYLQDERDKIVFNVEVTRVAISPCGEWIASIEMRDDHHNFPEIRLKFWRHLVASENKYSLNTTIHLPHKDNVLEMRFSPDSQFMVSTSKDKTFKIWHSIQEKKDNQTDKYWICGRIGYRNLTSTPSLVAISADSSLLAVCFDSVITFWDMSDVNSLVYKETFTTGDADDLKLPVKRVEFGTGEKSHLLVEAKESMLRVWDVINLGISWTWKPPSSFQVDAIIYDYLTNRVATFVSDNNLYLFSIDENVPIFKVNVSREGLPNILSNIFTAFGLFVPRKRVHQEAESSPESVFKESQLFFMNTNQELLTILPKSEHMVGEKTEQRIKLVENIEAQTPFAMMLINKRNKALASGDSQEVSLHQEEMRQFFEDEINADKLVDEMFLKVPSHVLPPIEKMCATFLRSLLVSSKSSGEDEKKMLEDEKRIKEKRAGEVVDEEKMESEDEEDVKDVELAKKEDEDYLEFIGSYDTVGDIKNFVFEEDFSWLKNYDL